MFSFLWDEPKKESPRWVRAMWPYLMLLRHNRGALFQILFRGRRFYWHYSWEPDDRVVDTLSSGDIPSAIYED